MNGTATEMDIANATRPPMDPWAAMVSWLASDAPDVSLAKSRCNWPVRRVRSDSIGVSRPSIAAERARRPSVSTRTAKLTFVERFTTQTVSITWRDATAANYCEQLWIRRVARSRGTCALTGSAIVRGDIVYGPASRVADRPANCAQMVLAHVLEGLEQSTAGARQTIRSIDRAA